MGIVAKELPTMKLSYHGASHYNSLVDPKKPPPLGDGAKSEFKMKNFRIQHELAEQKKMEEMKKQIANKSKFLTPEDFKAAWYFCSLCVVLCFCVDGASKLFCCREKRGGAKIPFISSAPELAADMFRTMFLRMSEQLKVQGDSGESLKTAYSESRKKVAVLVADVVKANPGKVSYEVALKVLFVDMYPKYESLFKPKL